MLAIQDQLGLRLQKTKSVVDILVVDHLRKDAHRKLSLLDHLPQRLAASSYH
jgi:Protein of unknown function (DUF3738)